MSKSFSKFVLAGLVFVGFNAHASEFTATSAVNNEIHLSFMGDSELSLVQGAKTVTFANDYNDPRWAHHHTSAQNASKPSRASSGSKFKFGSRFMGLLGMSLGVASDVRNEHQLLTKYYSDPKSVQCKKC